MGQTGYTPPIPLFWNGNIQFKAVRILYTEDSMQCADTSFHIFQPHTRRTGWVYICRISAIIGNDELVKGWVFSGKDRNGSRIAVLCDV